MVKVKKLIIRKVDSSHNFGEIEINDVSGSINIGSVYEGDFSAIIKEKLGKKIKHPSPFEKNHRDSI
ncbi:hypothetical protein [Neobacillus mesonae]|uniref:hypothetical protein n=1 Tax=Neobacillus mesonae TaxID=1193713 RepID=UPI00203EBF37|nr:hypothetical protein [Neobacillus mesonae]MCM3568836.1 hypothetical protein [Neobacillus mesonae]